MFHKIISTKGVSGTYMTTIQKHSKKPIFSGTSPAFTIVELLIVVVVIAILAAITIVAYNGVTNRAKDSARTSELSQWKKKSEVYKIQNNIECPNNYVFVYGNSAFGTSDFCVMKYEAKILGNDNGQTTYNASMAADSRPSGTPWVNISQVNAIAKATEAGGHLITEAEWMTIAADVLSVKHNWSGGAVGSGVIYQGHVNNNPASALAASSDDTDALNGITGGTGATNGYNSSRVLYLSSGDAIWDFGGNVYEWTQPAIGTPTLTMNQIGVSGDSAYNWREWNFGSLSLGNLPSVSRPSTIASVPGLENITSWSSANGIGRIYANYSDSAARAFRRSGDWSNGSVTGVLAIVLNLPATSLGPNTSFRVAR